MQLIVGLGNPGASYQNNRHNIGFMAVDALAEHYQFRWGRKFGELAEGRIGDQKLFFLKPQTYMNLSGEAVGAAARFYKIPPEEILVLHDELDLEPGKLRAKLAGGDGGHNGLKSIDQHIGKNYWRVRIGIGHPGNKDLVSPYVLGNFMKEEWPVQEKMLAAITEAFPLALENDIAAFMNKVALIINPPPPKPKPETEK